MSSRTRRLAGATLLAGLLLAGFVACDGGASADEDGGAGSSSDAAGAAGSSTGGRSGGSGGTPGSGGAPSDLAPITFAEYCERRADLYFEYLATCYGSEAYPEEEQAEFVGRMNARCLDAADAIDEGRLTYDGAQGAACVAGLEELDCVAGASGPACGGVFAGQSEPGDDCYGDETLVFLVGVSTCEGGRCAGDSCPGTCVALPDTGEECSGFCKPGDLCNSDARCEPRPGIGEACPDFLCVDGASCLDGVCVRLTVNRDEPCGDDALCGGPTVCDDGTCKWSVDLGAPCRLSSHCPSGAACRDETCQLPADEGSGCSRDEGCVEGLHCAGPDGEKTCKPFASLGDVCGAAGGLRCAPEHSCVQTTDELEAHCRVRVGLGESCADSFELCEAGLYCNAARVCAPPGSVGDTCWAVHPCEDGLGCRCAAEDTDECVTSGQDDGDTCQPRLADGEPCFSFQECESLDCDFSMSDAPDEPGECVTTAATTACLP